MVSFHCFCGRVRGYKKKGGCSPVVRKGKVDEGGSFGAEGWGGNTRGAGQRAEIQIVRGRGGLALAVGGGVEGT